MVKNKSEYNSLSEWRKENLSDYNSAKYRGFLCDICDYFGWNKPDSYWRIKENTINESRKHISCDDWVNSSPGSYIAAIKYKWIEECVSHMEGYLKVYSAHWGSKRACVEDAKKYNTIYEWSSKSPLAYQSALENKRKNWMYECTKHMSDIW